MRPSVLSNTAAAAAVASLSLALTIWQRKRKVAASNASGKNGADPPTPSVNIA